MSLHGVAIALLLVPAVAAAGLALREIRLAGVGYLGNPSLYFSIMAFLGAGLQEPLAGQTFADLMQSRL